MRGIPLSMYFWYLFPIIIFFIGYQVMTYLPLKEKFNLKLPDIVTPFLLLGIHRLSVDSFQASSLPYLMILILLVGIAVALSHAYYFGDIQYKRFFKFFWRLVFLVSVVIYITMIIYNIVTYL